MKKDCTEIGQNETGNTIYKSEYNGQEFVFVGNDGYTAENFGKFTVQVESNGQWNQIENGLIETESEADELVNGLIAEGFSSADELRYEQI